VRAFVIGTKALVDTAGAIAFHHFDDLAVALDIATLVIFRDRLDSANLGKAVFCYPPWGPWLLSHTARTDSKQKQLRLHVHGPLRARTNSRQNPDRRREVTPSRHRDDYCECHTGGAVATALGQTVTSSLLRHWTMIGTDSVFRPV
jgi:hypothetical protein